MMSLHFITNQRVRAIAAPQHRSGGPSDLSRQEAAQPKALLTIAGALDDLPGLLATACGFLIFFLVYGVFA